MRGENTPTFWRAGGLALSEIAPARGEYQAIVKLALSLGEDCPPLIAAGELCCAEALALKLSADLRQALDETGHRAGRLRVVEVSIPEPSHG